MPDAIRPVMFVWSEPGIMIPVPRFKTLCGRQFAFGEHYALGPIDNIPSKGRGGFFIDLHNAWSTIREGDNRFPSEEHFRKRALVAAGWATHSQTIMETPKDARLFAIGMRKADEYAVITVKGCVVDVWVAKSIANGQITAEQWKVVRPKAVHWMAEQARTTKEALEQMRSETTTQ